MDHLYPLRDHPSFAANTGLELFVIIIIGINDDDDDDDDVINHLFYPYLFYSLFIKLYLHFLM